MKLPLRCYIPFQTLNLSVHISTSENSHIIRKNYERCRNCLCQAGSSIRSSWRLEAPTSEMLPPGEGGHLFFVSKSQHYTDPWDERTVYLPIHEWLNFVWAFHGSVNIQISPMDPVCGNGIQSSKEFVWFYFEKKKLQKKKQNLGFGLDKIWFPLPTKSSLANSFSGGGGNSTNLHLHSAAIKKKLSLMTYSKVAKFNLYGTSQTSWVPSGPETPGTWMFVSLGQKSEKKSPHVTMNS